MEDDDDRGAATAERAPPRRRGGGGGGGGGRGSASVRDAPVDFRFIAPPYRMETSGQWHWPHLRVAPSVASRGRGLRATERVARGLIVPYVGDIWIDSPRNKERLRVIGKRHKTSYIIEGQLETAAGDKCPVVVDADPSLGAHAGELCIVGFVNEASKSLSEEKYNCKFFDLGRDYMENLPEYPAFPAGVSIFLVTMVDLEPGEELIVWYGPKFDRKGYDCKPLDQLSKKQPRVFDDTDARIMSGRLAARAERWWPAVAASGDFDPDPSTGALGTDADIDRAIATIRAPPLVDPTVPTNLRRVALGALMRFPKRVGPADSGNEDSTWCYGIVVEKAKHPHDEITVYVPASRERARFDADAARADAIVEGEKQKMLQVVSAANVPKASWWLS